jgi:AcrR family transcriptional regulator
MNYIAERRLEEKERRRAEILDAAEHVAAAVGWDDMTMDQVARKARLSRALLYVYFKDKNDLMFGINERALVLLRQKFEEVMAKTPRGIDQIEGFGRAYVALSQEFPVYFDVLTRCELVVVDEIEPESNEAVCLKCGDAVFELMGQALETGIRDGSIRPDIGPLPVVAVTLWGFMHGIMQVATTKATVLVHRGVETNGLMEKALELSLLSLRATAAAKQK